MGFQGQCDLSWRTARGRPPAACFTASRRVRNSSSLTVGPQARLTIDRFVYDPNSKSGALAINASQGVFRFVGGKISKNEGGVTVNTPSGALATLLASVGLYGVMAFVVARRRRGLGIRLALGAQPTFVIWMVMREVLLLLAIGLAVGVPAGIALGRYVASQLYGIQPRDPSIAGWTIVLLTLVSAVAGLIPAQRASRIDPILALRTE